MYGGWVWVCMVYLRGCVGVCVICTSSLPGHKQKPHCTSPCATIPSPPHPDHSHHYFPPHTQHNKKEWSIALITTICILVGSTLFMLLLVHIILPCSIAIHARRKTPREDQEDTMTTEKGTIPTEKVSNQSSDTTDSTVLDKGSDSLVVVEEGVCQGDGSQTSQSRLFRVASGLRSMLTTISQSSGDRSVHRYVEWGRLWW